MSGVGARTPGRVTRPSRAAAVAVGDDPVSNASRTGGCGPVGSGRVGSPRRRAVLVGVGLLVFAPPARAADETLAQLPGAIGLSAHAGWVAYSAPVGTGAWSLRTWHRGVRADVGVAARDAPFDVNVGPDASGLPQQSPAASGRVVASGLRSHATSSQFVSTTAAPNGGWLSPPVARASLHLPSGGTQWHSVARFEGAAASSFSLAPGSGLASSGPEPSPPAAATRSVRAGRRRGRRRPISARELSRTSGRCAAGVRTSATATR